MPSEAPTQTTLSRYGQILRLERELDDAKAEYLRDHGWQWRSDFPDHFWRWVRDFPNGQITAGTDEAVRLTQNVLDKEMMDYGD